ncbi:putative target SNARE [Trypanosoma theileri]|uniref:Putative target SNARE n=1 Tax=Trypanosoma theileri TaxID=67003 RepID=A0A1X0P5W4_9TRYP|nr:putative target SNARE [Trypanosoma theileri]ORC91949.1 putative target SNARE [Trypanosoma theileri]
MIRVLRSPAVLPAVRSITIGGRSTRGGFSRPLGKHPQVKQGVTDGVPRRIPGTTKVTYTNKKGRTFSFSIPLAEITHPPVNLTNASGSWKEMDTSFCDLGDMEDDMPSAVDDCLQVNPEERSVVELCEAFVSFCKEYVLMDTTGMKNTPSPGELNVGPDYEHYDRRLKRKRHWLAIRHRFEDVRHIIWPDEEEAMNTADGALLSVGEMLNALQWLEAASTFCVRKVHPADVVEKEELLPLNLHREVEVVARYARNDPTLFRDMSNTTNNTNTINTTNSTSTALERFITCAALCCNHGVPFSSFFGVEQEKMNDIPSTISISSSTSTDAVATDDLSNGKCILTNMPFVQTVFGAIRLMSVTENDSSVYGFSNASGVVDQREVMQGLSRLMSVEAFGEKNALENVGESELCTIMRFCVEIKERNTAFFTRTEPKKNEEEVSFMAKYQQLSQMALARCKYLLYRLDGPRTQIMSEDGFIPIVEMQKHAERTNKDTLIHYNLGIRSAQGLRRVKLGAKSSAVLAELVERLEVSENHSSGNTLLLDLVQHLSQKAAASKVSVTLSEVNRLLPLLARMQSETPTGILHSRFNRLMAVLDTAIGAAMQQKRTVVEVVDLVEGLAACNFLPSSFKQVEMVLLRLMMTQDCSITQVTRILKALSTLLNSKVSQVLLQSAASHVTIVTNSLTKEKESDNSDINNSSDSNSSNGNRDDRIAEQLVELLEALDYCGYAALSGLVVLCREKCFPVDVQLSLKGRCSYASLLTSTAISIRDQDELLFKAMVIEARQHFVEYARNSQEKDLNQFVNCITGLSTVGFDNVSENEDIRLALIDYLKSPCVTIESCSIMSAITLAAMIENIYVWSEMLKVSCPDVVSPFEKALLLKLLPTEETSSSSSVGTVGATPTNITEELSEAACRVVGLQQTSMDIRRAAAEVLGNAILCAEAAADRWKSIQQESHPHRSFEVVALATAESETNHAETVLRYCAALQQSGMAHHVEGSVL